EGSDCSCCPASAIKESVSETCPSRFRPVSAAQNGYRYRAIFSNSTGTASTKAATLTVEAPARNRHPASRRDRRGWTQSIVLRRSDGDPSPRIQWQQSGDGGFSFSDISGATGHSYAFKASISENGYRYRAVFTNAVGSATTTAVTLSVA